MLPYQLSIQKIHAWLRSQAHAPWALLHFSNSPSVKKACRWKRCWLDGTFRATSEQKSLAGQCRQIDYEPEANVLDWKDFPIPMAESPSLPSTSNPASASSLRERKKHISDGECNHWNRATTDKHTRIKVSRPSCEGIVPRRNCRLVSCSTSSPVSSPISEGSPLQYAAGPEPSVFLIPFEHSSALDKSIRAICPLTQVIPSNSHSLGFLRMSAHGWKSSPQNRPSVSTYRMRKISLGDRTPSPSISPCMYVRPSHVDCPSHCDWLDPAKAGHGRHDECSVACPCTLKVAGRHRSASQPNSWYSIFIEPTPQNREGIDPVNLGKKKTQGLMIPLPGEKKSSQFHLFTYWLSVKFSLRFGFSFIISLGIVPANLTNNATK